MVSELNSVNSIQQKAVPVMPQFVRLTNLDPSPFDFHHKGVKRIVPVGGDTIVPWDLAATLFGDPGLVDAPRDPQRTMALKRAKANFGYMEGMESDAEFDARRPHVEVWDIESSPLTRVWMLIEDPEGTHTTEYAETNGQSEIEMLHNRMAIMQQQIERLINTQTSVPPARPDTQTVIPSNDAPAPVGVNDVTAIAAAQERARVMAQFAAQTQVTMPDDTAPPIQVVEVSPAHEGELDLANDLAADAAATASERMKANLAAQAAKAAEAISTLATATVDGPTPPAVQLAPRPVSPS